MEASLKKGHVKTSFGIIYIENDILFTEYLVQDILQIEAIEAMVKARKELSEGRKLSNVTDLRGIKDVSEDAIKFAYSRESLDKLTALAFVYSDGFLAVSNAWALRFFNMYIPTKIFTDKLQAINFAKKYS